MIGYNRDHICNRIRGVECREMKDSNAMNFPVNLQVGSVQSCSGVFIGAQNVTYGWSSHSKSNVGFGSVQSSNLIYRNFTVLQDQDSIDTPIDDRDVHVFTQTHRKPQITNIGFQSMNVDSMAQNAGVFVGDSNLTGWDTHQKSNTGSGAISG